MSEAEAGYGSVQGSRMLTMEERVDRLNKDIASMHVDLCSRISELERENKHFKERVEALVDRYADRLNLIEERLYI
jgi:tRNA uridine 5-carbamoylmethylation protein Kti12